MNTTHIGDRKEWLRLRMIRCLAVLVLVVGTSDGTTGVVFRSDAFILIGTDSLVVLMGQNAGTGKMCKIIQTGRFFVVVAGMFGRFARPGAFNAYTLLQDIAKNETTAVAVANSFEKIAQKPYKNYMRKFQKEDPTDFERACKNKCPLQVIVADYDAGRLTYAFREFRTVLNHNVPAIEISVHFDCPGTCVLPRSFDLFGENGEASPLTSFPDFWGSSTTFGVDSVATAINTLIKVEEQAHPDLVGDPISILALDKDGPHWVPGYQGVCPNLTAEEGTHQALNPRTDQPEESHRLIWMIVAVVLLVLSILWYAISHRRTGK